MKPENKVFKLLLLSVMLLAAGMLQTSALGLGQEAGSLLLFPYYDSRPGAITVITVTNTNNNTVMDPLTGLQGGTIDLLFNYIDEIQCLPEDRVERLTPNDTFSFTPRGHNPKAERGFLYVYAIDPDSGMPVAFDYLIGTETIFDAAGQVDFNLNPLAFKAGSLGPNDHMLSLDGFEYEKMPAEIQIPRFFGQGNGLVFPSPFVSEIIFINLTGGAWFRASADILIYNDNEQAFSSTVEFDCWDILPSMQVGAATRLGFLESSNHDPTEVSLGGFVMETGWLRIRGDYAYNNIRAFDDPAIYAIQIERQVAGGYAAATLPFEKGERDTGCLWSIHPTGQ